MILSDNETKVDLLNNEAIARTIVKLLKDRADRPVTVGVHGDWGAGKSSVLEMIEAELAKDGAVLCLKFNGWRFQGFEDAKIALIEGIVTELVEKRPAVKKAAGTVKDIYKRIDWLKVAKKAGSLAVTAFTGIPTPDIVQTAFSALDGLIANPMQLASPDNLKAAVETARGFLKPAEARVPEEVAEFHKAFKNLLNDAGVAQLVVLIDDLDRCLPEIAIETLEAIRLFVFTQKTAFVVAADEAMIEYAVRKHFPDLPDTTGPQTYARNYLEKLIQIPCRIPALGETETRIYVTLLLIGEALGEKDESFIRLIDGAREKLRRPWVNGVIDAAMLKEAIGEKANDKTREGLVLSDQIGPILASGTRGNPRQIKRFLNTLLLRQASATARGFGNDVKATVLAKLMLAERFLTREFDQIALAAAAASNGVCADLAALEAAASGKETAKEPVEAEEPQPSGLKATKLEAVKSAEPSAQVAEWLKSPAMKEWARVQPLIGNTDLRPYLFVTKDRKNYFGATSALGRLASVVEKLLGSKFSVQPMEPELKKLASPEAAQVFEALKSRIIASDDFETPPAGIDGLTILIRAHPSLEPALLDFLESLPYKRLGAWICRGWESVIRDPKCAERFDALLEVLSKEGSATLRMTAGAVLATRRKGGR
jgi:predicted KAP-like P-loop ATPase